MKRFIMCCLLSLVTLVFVTSVADASKRRGVPDRGTVRIGPVEIGARVHGLNRQQCGCDPVVTPNDARVLEPSIGYVYQKPGDRYASRDWTWGYIQTFGARTVTLLVVPDDSYNIRSVRLHYPNRTVQVRRGQDTYYSRHWDKTGYRFMIGSLSGTYVASITIEYEDAMGNLVATRTDCVTIDAQRW